MDFLTVRSTRGELGTAGGERGFPSEWSQSCGFLQLLLGRRLRQLGPGAGLEYLWKEEGPK